MTVHPKTDPAELRMILGDNLRQLSKNASSISELCREIGVNRTQFNRYLSGNAFPRPDVLSRICQHFGVDATILLRRIDDAPSVAPLPSPPEAILSASQRPFDHYLLPDGIYRYWRRSFRQPDRAYMGMSLISTKGTAKVWKGYDIHDSAVRSGTGRHARSSSYEGALIQQFDGFALISRTAYSDLMNVTYFEYGLEQLLDYYSGITFITRRRLSDGNRLSAIVMQRVPATCASVLACARQCGSQSMAGLPPVVRLALERVPERI